MPLHKLTRHFNGQTVECGVHAVQNPNGLCLLRIDRAATFI